MGKLDEATGVTAIITPGAISGEVRLTVRYDDYDEEDLGVVARGRTPDERRVVGKSAAEAYLAGKGFDPVGGAWEDAALVGIVRDFTRKGAA